MDGGHGSNGCHWTDGQHGTDGSCWTCRCDRTFGHDWAHWNHRSNRCNGTDGSNGTHRCHWAHWSHVGHRGNGSNGGNGSDRSNGTDGAHRSPRTHGMDREFRRHRSYRRDGVLLFGSNGSNANPNRSARGLWSHRTGGGSGINRMGWSDGKHGLSWTDWTNGVDGSSLDGTRWASPVVNDWGRRPHWTHRTSLDEDGDDRGHRNDRTDRLDGVDGTDGTDRLDGVDGVDGTDRLDGTCHRDDWPDGTSVELSSLSHLKSPSECNRLVQRSHHWSHCNDKLPPLRSLRAEWTPASPGLLGLNAHPNRDSGVSRVL